MNKMKTDNYMYETRDIDLIKAKQEQKKKSQ